MTEPLKIKTPLQNSSVANISITAQSTVTLAKEAHKWAKWRSKIRRACCVALIFIVTTSLGTLAFSQAVSSTKTGDFVRQASIGNQFEIISSQLAVKRTTMPEVRDFAQMMIADHTKVGDTLENTLASSDLGILPAKDLDEKHLKTLGDLKSASAENFDNLYIQTQSDAHDEAVSLFRNYAKNGDNIALIKFSSDVLPILEQHHQRINNLRQPLMSSRP